MSIEDDKFDFEMYLRKSATEPDPKPGSPIWADDPFKHDETYHLKRKGKRKKPPLKKKKGKR